MQRLTLPVYRFFKAHRALMYAILIITSVLFAFLASRLRFEEDITKLLPQTKESADSRVVFGQLSIKDKIFVELAPRDGSSLTPEELAASCDEFIQTLTALDSSTSYIGNILYRIEDEWAANGLDLALSQFPAFISPDSYARFDSLLTPAALDAAMKKNAEIINADEEGNRTMLVGYDPVGLRYALLGQLPAGLGGNFKVIDKHLFSPDSTVALAFVAPAVSAFDSQASSKLVKLVKKAARAVEKDNPQVEVLYHGATARAAANSDCIKSDVLLTVSISLLIILILLVFCFKSLNVVWRLLIPVGYGALFAMACMYVMKGGMSLMALGLGAVVLGIATSYVLHVLTHYKYIPDPEQVLEDQSTPVVLGCLTTIGTFSGLIFTTSELLRDFGIFASLGLAGSTFAALVFLPQMLSKRSRLKGPGRAFKTLDKINAYPMDRKYWFSAILVAAIVLGCVFSGKVGFDSNLQNINYFPDVMSRSESIYAEKVNNNLTSVFFASSGDNLDEAMQNYPAVVATLDSLKAAGLVSKVNSYAPIMLPKAQREANIEAWSNYWTAQKVESTEKAVAAAARRCGLEPEMFDSFSALIEAEYEDAPVLDSGLLPEELVSNTTEFTGGKQLVFASALMNPQDKKQVCDAVASKPDSFVLEPFYYISDMVKVVHDDFSTVLLISSIFVLLVLLISFRSVTITLIAFLPMALSWYVVQGYMALFGLQFNLINIMVSSFIFGVGVDYSIFIMDGLLEKAKGGRSELLTYHKTAISMSAFILLTVVASLLFAKSPALSSVGICTIIGMVSTILISYCLQPLIFRLATKSKFFRSHVLKLKEN